MTQAEWRCEAKVEFNWPRVCGADPFAFCRFAQPLTPDDLFAKQVRAGVRV
ncbi:MAG: hypothetical protein K9G60_10150 [Pseudolabrys sp.]|nr:hypothetical protein [Pseudolabrys sp.]